ncbi:hypothetical protein A3L12_08185 [Thermococcus sp. P6]|nr:hypothetical protein A3L12_08185 [Thermococcus sp. P6]
MIDPVLIFLLGFLILYYAIRKLACATSSLCSSAHWPETSTIASLDTLVVFFLAAVLLISALWYLSSKEFEKHE